MPFDVGGPRDQRNVVQVKDLKSPVNPVPKPADHGEPPSTAIQILAARVFSLGLYMRML